MSYYLINKNYLPFKKIIITKYYFLTNVSISAPVKKQMLAK
jgi:hypothetical protein